MNVFVKALPTRLSKPTNSKLLFRQRKVELFLFEVGTCHLDAYCITQLVLVVMATANETVVALVEVVVVVVDVVTVVRRLVGGVVLLATHWWVATFPGIMISYSFHEAYEQELVINIPVEIEDVRL